MVTVGQLLFGNVGKQRRWGYFGFGSKHLRGCPQRAATISGLLIIPPKKPNSAKRRVALVILKGLGTAGKVRVLAFIPSIQLGIIPKLSIYSGVLLGGRGPSDTPGVSYRIVCGSGDHREGMGGLRAGSKYGLNRDSILLTSKQLNVSLKGSYALKMGEGLETSLKELTLQSIVFKLGKSRDHEIEGIRELLQLIDPNVGVLEKDEVIGELVAEEFVTNHPTFYTAMGAISDPRVDPQYFDQIHRLGLKVTRGELGSGLMKYGGGLYASLKGSGLFGFSPKTREQRRDMIKDYNVLMAKAGAIQGVELTDERGAYAGEVTESAGISRNRRPNRLSTGVVAYKWRRNPLQTFVHNL